MMATFELEWERSEKEQHARLLYQLKRELADQRKVQSSVPVSRSENLHLHQKSIPSYRPSATAAR